MERLDATAPPVVAVMVVHQPDDSFDDVLRALAAQDYPDLRILLLVVGDAADMEQVRQRSSVWLPAAVIRSAGGNPGFGPVCNIALDLVEGDRGFFLLMHDDVALDTSAVRCLVEELYRSNAGIVGPKLVEWDDPRRLHRVGLGVDRVGEVDPLVEPGELDQEQHDALRDVFALPSACLLIRADLFRLLRFDDGIDFHGEDVDLCWRAHLTGARVLLVPAARARHRGRLPERRPDLAHRALMARHRVWSVATLTGARRLPGVLVRLVLVTLVELVAGVVTGRFRESGSALVAVVGLIARLPRVVARRRRIRSLRVVPEGEIAYLQMRGSARLQRYRRARQSGAALRRRRVQGTAPLQPGRTAGTAVAWAVAVGVVVVGSRRLILDGVAPIGEMLMLPASPADMLSRYLDAWWGDGLGASQAAPTGVALVGLAGLAVAGQMGLLHTVTTVGLLIVGLMGLWRLGRRLNSEVGRRACLLGGVLVPFAVGALAAGRWSTLLLWAATPWWVDAIAEAGSAPPWRHRPGRWRGLAGIVVSVAVVAAFVPAAMVLVPLLGMAVGVGTVLGHEHSAVRGLVEALRGLWRCVVGVVGAALVHLPWSWSFVSSHGWHDLMASAPRGTTGTGWWDLAQWGRSGVALAGLSALMLVPVVTVALLARDRHAVWGLRAATLVGGFGLLSVAVDRGLLPFESGDVWWWMAPVAVGSALAVGVLAAAWRDDVVTRSLGWRQPLGIITGAAVVAAALGSLVAVVDGRWEQPRSALPVLLGQLPHDDPAGDHRVLFVGDTRVVPVRSRGLADGLGYAVVDDGPLTATAAHWSPSANAAVRSVGEALGAMADDRTARLGRMLAPVGIRYIVVPLVDGVVSTAEEPLPAPVGLLDRLGRQLDLRRRSVTADLVIFENAAWLPTRAMLRGATAEASQRAGIDALAAGDLGDRRPLMVGSPSTRVGEATVTLEGPAVIHAGVPRSAEWSLTVDGRRLEPRTSFGTVTGWDLPGGGTVRLRMGPPRDPVRWLVIAGQGLVWLALLVLATGRRSGGGAGRRAGGRRSNPVPTVTEPVVRLGDAP